MLFKILKVFGLDVPAKIEAAKSSLELRVERATDRIKEVAEEGHRGFIRAGHGHFRHGGRGRADRALPLDG
jgi:hypothetical protein